VLGVDGSGNGNSDNTLKLGLESDREWSFWTGSISIVRGKDCASSGLSEEGCASVFPVQFPVTG
jgi:hypothetical protein